MCWVLLKGSARGGGRHRRLSIVTLVFDDDDEYYKGIYGQSGKQDYKGRYLQTIKGLATFPSNHRCLFSVNRTTIFRVSVILF